MTRALITLAPLAVVAATVALPAQAPTFSSRREVVRVDALVTTPNGEIVRNLTASDFTVLDSGVVQQPELVTLESLPVTVMLILDASASVSGERLERLRDAGHAVLQGLERDDQAGLLTFGRRVGQSAPITHDMALVNSVLDQMAAEPFVSGGGTTLIDACFSGLVLADQDAGRTLMIVFTDGVDTSSWLTADRVLDAARRSNVVAYGVSTSPLAKQSFLREFSERTGGSTFQAAAATDLRPAFLRIVEEFRQRYVISFTQANVPQTGWHPLTVRARARNIVVRARAGYTR